MKSKISPTQRWRGRFLLVVHFSISIFLPFVISHRCGDETEDLTNAETEQEIPRQGRRALPPLLNKKSLNFCNFCLILYFLQFLEQQSYSTYILIINESNIISQLCDYLMMTEVKIGDKSDWHSSAYSS